MGKGIALIILGEYDRALGCFDKALKLNPENAFAWKYKGRALEGLGKNDEAAACFKKAEDLEASGASGSPGTDGEILTAAERSYNAAVVLSREGDDEKV